MRGARGPITEGAGLMKNLRFLVKPLVYLLLILIGTFTGYVFFSGTIASAYASVSEASNQLPVVKDALPPEPPTWTAALAGGIGAALASWVFYTFVRHRVGKSQSHHYSS